MNVVFPVNLKKMAEFEVGEIGLCNFGGGAELAMLVVKLDDSLGFAMMHDRYDSMFVIHYVEYRSDLCLSYGQDWKMVIDHTGEIQMGPYVSPEIGDMIMWNGVHGICTANMRHTIKTKLNCPITGTIDIKSVIQAVFRSWKIVLNEIDPETGLAPVIFRHNT